MIRPQPLGDAAALVYLPDEEAAWRFATASAQLLSTAVLKAMMPPKAEVGSVFRALA